MSAVTTERIATGPATVLVVHVDDGKANASSRATIAEIMAALDEAGPTRRWSVVLHGRRAGSAPGSTCR
jgi:enoyl-CoA hydratase/carnithine racemase